MGNCCKPASSEWDGEDWTFLNSSSKNTSSSKVFDEAHADGPRELRLGKVQKEKLMGALRASDPDANGTVKIRISKKELAELLESRQKVNKKEGGEASAEQVLLRLIKARDHDVPHSHRFWRPVLDTIPEVS